MAQDGEEIVLPENSTVPDPQETPQTTPTITDEQQSVLLSLNEICSEETLETCKRALERNSWNLENAVMELISPEVEPTPTPEISASTTIIPPQTSQTPSAAAFGVQNSAFRSSDADLPENNLDFFDAEFDDDGHQIDGFTDNVTPLISTPTSSSSLRHRTHASNNTNNASSSRDALINQINSVRTRQTTYSAFKKKIKKVIKNIFLKKK